MSRALTCEQRVTYETNTYFKAAMDAIECSEIENREAVITEIIHRLSIRVEDLGNLALHATIINAGTAVATSEAITYDSLRKEKDLKDIRYTEHRIREKPWEV